MTGPYHKRVRRRGGGRGGGVVASGVGAGRKPPLVLFLANLRPLSPCLCSLNLLSGMLIPYPYRPTTPSPNVTLLAYFDSFLLRFNIRRLVRHFVSSRWARSLLSVLILLPRPSICRLTLLLCIPSSPHFSHLFSNSFNVLLEAIRTLMEAKP